MLELCDAGLFLIFVKNCKNYGTLNLDIFPEILNFLVWFSFRKIPKLRDWTQRWVAHNGAGDFGRFTDNRLLYFFLELKLVILISGALAHADSFFSPQPVKPGGTIGLTSVRPSVCPSVRLSVCPSVRLSVCPSVRHALSSLTPPTVIGPAISYRCQRIA